MSQGNQDYLRLATHPFLLERSLACSMMNVDTLSLK